MIEFIPKYKDDFQSIENLKLLEFKDVSNNVIELLEWLQDLHWPVAAGIGSFFKRYVKEIDEELVSILKSNDVEWKYNIIYIFFKERDLQLSDEILIELNRIALNPNVFEKEEEVDELAKEVLAAIKNSNG